MIVLSESLLLDGAPQRDPMAIPHNLTHNPDLHFTFTKFWKRYGKFARHLMKVCQFTTDCNTKNMHSNFVLKMKLVVVCWYILPM